MSALGKPLRVVRILADLPHGPQYLGFAQAYDRARIRVTWVHLRTAPTEFDRTLEAMGERVIGMPATTRWQQLCAWLRLVGLFLRQRPQVVHAELHPAALLGLSAAWLCGIRLRIHTRHYSTLNHLYYPRAVRVDRWLVRLSTLTLAVSETVRRVLVETEGVPAHNVRVCWNTFEMARFRDVPVPRVETLRAQYLPAGAGPVVGIVARWFELKGVDYAVQAFLRLREQYPGAFLLLVNAFGPSAPTIEAELRKLPSGSYIALRYEPSVEALYKLMDVYVHVPIDPTVEAFGQTYVEALATGTPMVCTLSGIAPEFVEHGKTAWVVPYKDSEAIYAGIRGILEDAALRTTLAQNGPASVAGKFEMETQVRFLEAIYCGEATG